MSTTTNADDVTHARGVLECSADRFNRIRIAGAKLLGALHTQFDKIPGEMRAIMIEHLADMLDELDAIDSDVEEALDLLPTSTVKQEGSAVQ
jgi:hypothetical protein